MAFGPAAAAAASKKGGADSEAAATKALESFDTLCKVLEAMFVDARCERQPKGAEIAMKGCSRSTVLEYMSCLSSAIDNAKEQSVVFRETFKAHPRTASRRPNEDLDGLTKRSSTVDADNTAEDGVAGTAAEGAAVANALARQRLKEELRPGTAAGEEPWPTLNRIV